MAQAKQQIVKFQKGKHSFLVVCYPGSVLQYREGKLGISKVLQIDQVYTNVQRGDRASAEDLRAVFGDINEQEILAKIVEEGEIEYSASERKKFMDDKVNEIIYYIHKNWMDPKTKLPHPIDRIKNAIQGSKKKISIDLKQDSKKQAQDIVKKLQGSIMFAKAVVSSYKLTIKYTYDGKCKNLIHGIASKVEKEDYTGEGCEYTIELTKGDMDALMQALAKPTNGDYTLVEQALSSSTGDATAAKKDERGGKGQGGEKKGKKKKKASSMHGKRGQMIAEKMDRERSGGGRDAGTMASAGSAGSSSSSGATDGMGSEDTGKKGKKRKKNKSSEASESGVNASGGSSAAGSESVGQSNKDKRKRKGKKEKNKQ